MLNFNYGGNWGQTLVDFIRTFNVVAYTACV